MEELDKEVIENYYKRRNEVLKNMELRNGPIDEGKVLIDLISKFTGMPEKEEE